ncbi:MAG: glutamate--tRNA ligase [Rickettsiaceae bacterium H1]|nr:glutamate--tRNA ligase [Rickettsiaceae bacterium H1]
MQKKIVTRFAPSPTGFLHIGGARTALFNWLYAKHCQGKFLLRIEDTDEKRSNQKAIDAIISGLDWLRLNHDGKIIFQSQNRERHIKIVQELIDKGKAYYCYEQNNEKKTISGFRSKWRDNDNKEIPNVKPVVRIKAPNEGITTIRDQVYGDITVKNFTLEDFVILRSDGTPTYMLSVVIDDYDMKISHIIRGADHITNTAKQILLYNTLGWDIPIFAHIPLIHGSDGRKMSKRHGALGVGEYKNMGFLPEAVKNYLLRLSWGNKDNEIINNENAIKLFDLKNIGKSSVNFDLKKLEHINNYYLRNIDNIIEELTPFIGEISMKKKNILFKAIPVLQEKAKTLVELAEFSHIFIKNKIIMDKEAQKVLNLKILAELNQNLQQIRDWDEAEITSVIDKIAQKYKRKEIYQTLRAKLTGTMKSPSIILVMLSLGQKITLDRLAN